MILTRRNFFHILLCLAVLPTEVFSKTSKLLAPLALRLVRRTGWEELMARNNCIIGDLYLSNPHFPMSDLGTKLCFTLELAWRNNLNEISALPPGQYEGFARTDGNRGWRIELTGTGNRKNIQIHIGNRPKDTIGCILVGTGDSSDATCHVKDSQDAMHLVKSTYGSSNMRPVTLQIQ